MSATAGPMPSTDYTKLVASFDPNDATSFQEILVRMLSDLNMPAIDLCEEFDVSLATVGRWIDGRSAPAPELRSAVLERIAALMVSPEFAVAC
jgi:hypothetical protein